MTIRILQETDVQSYREIRLGGLKNNPEAFGSTYEREAGFPLERMIERVRPAAGSFVLGAFDGDRLIGIVRFMREDGMKDAHKAAVYGMYVLPEKRGTGVGRKLMLELIRRAKDMNGLEQIRLSVVSGNGAAKKLYASLGFEVYGTERHALKQDGLYYDEDLMTLFLTDTGRV